jgi:hypothetical protein
MATPATHPAPPKAVAVALWLASRGIHVHPLIAGRKLPPRNCNRCSPGTAADPNPLYIAHAPADCRCIAAGRYCHGVHAATTDPDRIAAWWHLIPDAAVGVAAGPSGLLILDVDRHGGDVPPADQILPGLDVPQDVPLSSVQDGLDVLALLCEIRKAPILDVAPSTLSVRTPSGGMQYWYRVPEGTAWRSNSSKLGWQLDVKAGWGYGIAPGSVTAKGTYQRVGDTVTIAELPAWLAADLKRTGHYVDQDKGRRRVRASQLLAQFYRKDDHYVNWVVETEITQLAGMTEGGRNDATYGAARALARFIDTGQLSETEAASATRSGIRTRRRSA